MTDFEEHLAPSPTLVFAFSSSRGDYGDLPRYEFGASLREMGLAYVLLRDSTEGWWQRGVAGIGDIDDVAAYMRRIMQIYPRSVALGLSSGAYAALLFGQRAPTHEVLALSPVTGQGGSVYPDFHPMHHHRVRDEPGRPVIDIKDEYRDGPRARVRVFVGDQPGTDLDRQMALRAGLTDVTLVPGSDHAGLARAMRDRGMLRELLA